MSQIFMLSGKLRSGKDTLANYLVKQYGFKRYGIADSLKEYVSNKYSIDIRLMHSQIGKEKIILVNDKEVSVRQLLINEGKAKTLLDNTFWTKRVVDQIKADKPDKIVISDFRFPFEYSYFSSLFNEVVTIRINRPNNESEYNQDSSETSLNKFQFDYIIDNDRSKDNMYFAFDNIFRFNDSLKK